MYMNELGRSVCLPSNSNLSNVYPILTNYDYSYIGHFTANGTLSLFEIETI